MKKILLITFLSIVANNCIFGQGALYIYKNNVMVYNRAVTDIDSAIYKKPLALNDTLFIYKSNALMLKRAVADIDSVTYFKKNTTITADFTISNGVGHPYVFGEQGGPIDNTTATKVKNQGFTFAREGFNMGNDATWCVVPTTTVANYKANVNNIQNSATWQWASFNHVSAYNTLNMPIMLTMSYCPQWLSSCSPDQRGIPQDWAVYEDIIQKIYLYVKSKYANVKFIEVWNEPTGAFLNLTGSTYTDKLTAYKDIYYHIAKAIRAVDATIPLGGPTAGDRNFYTWADSMLADSRLTSNINFFTYHLYDGNSGTDPVDIANWQAVAAKYGKPDMPIFMTEWNYAYWLGVTSMNMESPDAISYVGRRLTNFYVNHLAGANIYTMSVTSAGDQMGGIFTNGTFMPKARTFYLMSKILGLGAGDGALKGTTWTANDIVTNAGTALNFNNQKVIWVTNDTGNSGTVSVIIKGLVANTVYSAPIYEASAANTATTVREVVQFTGVAAGAEGIKFNLPAKSVVGLIVQ